MKYCIFFYTTITLVEHKLPGVYVVCPCTFNAEFSLGGAPNTMGALAEVEFVGFGWVVTAGSANALPSSSLS